MLPRHPLLFPLKTTRRKVVRTGAKLAYAAPMIATTLDVSRTASATLVPSPPICSHGAFSCGAPDPGAFRCAPLCLCFTQLGGDTVCARETECELVDPCDDTTPCPDGLVCVTDTCCDTPICVMPCAA